MERDVLGDQLSCEIQSSDGGCPNENRTGR
jgi:hypothetical protein